MTRAECAVQYVDDVARRVIARSLESNAVRHALIYAVLGGQRFEDEADVWRWLSAHTGLKALEVTRR